MRRLSQLALAFPYLLPALLVLALLPMVAHAQLKHEPERPVPLYESYMTICMDDQKPFTSEMETTVAAAACQCHFEQFPLTGKITLTQFMEGLKACQVEADKDPRYFVENYFSRVRNNFNKRYWPVEKNSAAKK